MNINLTFNKLFAFSENRAKYFYTEFSDQINIVHGRNTSGKSSLFLSILYAFGINDGNQYLSEILAEGVIFRIDCTIIKNGTSQNLTVVRDDETLIIKTSDLPIKRFNGISSNNSAEHIKFKHFLDELFDFSLLLESKNEYKQAPIETMFLPYYISQTVGWVYLRKSFSSLDFYKNFKEDYLDYYLGLEQSLDRVKRHELQARLRVKQDEIDLIATFETKSEDIQLTKLTDEQFVETSNVYIQTYAQNHTSLTERENEYVLKCNELGFLEERRATLSKVNSNHKTQKPEFGNCPTCAQTLPFGIAETYIFLQEENDTVKELTLVKGKIKDVQAKINSLQKSIIADRQVISDKYSVLNKYVNIDITYDRWLKHKANTELINTLNIKIGQLTVDKVEIEGQLKKYKTDEEIEKSRAGLSNSFTSFFLTFLSQLKVKKLEEDRYTKLYWISSFPSQGVELHKTTMAYHFAFNHLIAGTEGIHRFPFMLDAIFKEDLDDDNKKVILNFISKNKPRDTQTLISIAQTRTQLSSAASYNTDYFGGKAKLIQIGDGDSERCFLQEYKDNLPEYLVETLNIINGTINK